VTLPHIEEPMRVLSEAVTRPRLTIIRRNPPSSEKIEKPEKDQEKVKP